MSLCFAAAANPARAGETKLGAQVFWFSVGHFEMDPRENFQYNGIGLALEAWQRWRWLDLHVEATPASRFLITSFDGPIRPTSTINLADAVIHVAVDPRRRFWIGGGVNDLNEGVPSRVLSFETRSSRLIGGRYEARAVLPVQGANFEFQYAYLPAMRGKINFSVPLPIAPGVFLTAADTKARGNDYQLAYRWTRGNLEYLAGWRTLHYTVNTFALVTSVGEIPFNAFAFHNGATGPLFETRFVLGR